MDKTSKNKIKKEILLANPRGFCAGVERAIEIVEKSLEKYDCPVFVRHHVKERGLVKTSHKKLTN